MSKKKTSPALSVTRLVRCIRDLGLRVGWKYWRMGNRALRDPNLVLEWAELCEKEAQVTADPKFKAALQSWAHSLRVHWLLWAGGDPVNQALAIQDFLSANTEIAHPCQGTPGSANDDR